MTSAYLGDSGIVLSGPVDAEGVSWSWTGDDPWSPSPTPREVSGENAGDHGSWDATRFYNARSYALEGYVQAPNHVSLHRAKHRLFAACGLGFDMRVVEPGFDRTGWFRRSGEVLWSEVNPTTARFSVPLWAKDPRAYSTATHSASTPFPSTTGGLQWPTQWPAQWDGVSTSGELNLSNAGNETAWPTYRIDGPVVDPANVDNATGRAMRFAITLGAGEWLTVNTHTHQVLGNGDVNASRRNTFHGDWFGLAPGSNTVRFIGASGAGSTLSASYRDTWI